MVTQTTIHLAAVRKLKHLEDLRKAQRFIRGRCYSCSGSYDLSQALGIALRRSEDLAIAVEQCEGQSAITGGVRSEEPSLRSLVHHSNVGGQCIPCPS